MHMHQSIHVTNKIIHSTYVHPVITRQKKESEKTGTKVYVKSPSH